MRCKAGPCFSRWPHFIWGTELGLWGNGDTESSDCTEAGYSCPRHCRVGFPPYNLAHTGPLGTKTATLTAPPRPYTDSHTLLAQSVALISLHSFSSQTCTCTSFENKISFHHLKNDPVGSSQSFYNPLFAVAKNKCIEIKRQPFEPDGDI